MSEIKKNNNIDLINAFLKSSDVCRVTEFKSRNAEFRVLPPKLNVSLPKLIPREIRRYHLTEQFSFESLLSFITKEYYTIAT